MAAHVPPLPKSTVTALTGGYLVLSVWFVSAAATNQLPPGWLTQGWIEALGIAASLLFAWLEVRESAWNWPVAIVASIAYIEFFRRSGYYANMWLQLYYVVVSALGWYWWVRGGEKRTPLAITRATGKTWMVFLGIVVLAVPAVAGLMKWFHGSANALDVVTTVLSIGGEALLARKILETWWVWATVNALYVFMLLASPFSAGLYAIFLVLSVLGLVEWRRALANPSSLPES